MSFFTIKLGLGSKMKGIILVALLGVGFLSVNMTIEAAEYKDSTFVVEKSTETIPFEELAETDKAVELPEGSFLHGEAVIGSLGQDQDDRTVVDSDTATISVIVAEARET